MAYTEDPRLDKKIRLFATHFLLPVWKWLLQAEPWPHKSYREDCKRYLAAAFIFLELDEEDLSTPGEQQRFLDCFRQVQSPPAPRSIPARSKPKDNKESERQGLIEGWWQNPRRNHPSWLRILLDFLCRIIKPSGSESPEWQKYNSMLSRIPHLLSWDDNEGELKRTEAEIKQLTDLLIVKHAQHLMSEHGPREVRARPDPAPVQPPPEPQPEPAIEEYPASNAELARPDEFNRVGGQPEKPPLSEPQARADELSVRHEKPALALDEMIEEYSFSDAEFDSIHDRIRDARGMGLPTISEEQVRDVELYLWCEKPLPPGTTVFFVGDIHGDLLAFAAVQVLFEEVQGPKILVLLGDLVDRGPHSGAVVRAVAQMLSRRLYNEKVICLRGNHEDAVGYEAGKGYTSAVEPAEYIAELNRTNADDDWFARFVKTLPVALYFQEGVFASHGGLPLNDCFPYDRDRLGSRDYLQDFVWTRFAEDLPRKRPNRSSKTSEYGYEDIGRMLAQMEEHILKGKIHLYIRGHDHVKERFSIASRTNGRVVTINAMSTSAGEAFGEPHRKPAIVKWVVGANPKIVRLVLPGDLIDKMNAMGTEAAPESGADGSSPEVC